MVRPQLGWDCTADRERIVGDLALGGLDVAMINDYLLGRSRPGSISSSKAVVTGVRSLLRFLYLEGLIDRDLAVAVAPVANWRLASLVKALDASSVARLLDSCDQDTAVGRRDFAILLLLSRLGLRIGEVAALRLDVLDWRAGELVVCGKGKLRPRPERRDGLVLFIGAVACIFGLNIAGSKGREQLAIGLLFGLGLLLGLAVAPVIADYAKADPSALWQAAGATAAFVAACGAYGYATRRDLSSWARTLFWALLGLIVFGIVAIFVSIPKPHHLRRCRTRDLRRLHDLRLQPAAPSKPRQRRRDRVEHLPRHLQRVPALARPVRRQS